MGKSILIDLVFNANTSQAKSQMNSLQAQLNSLQASTTSRVSMTGLTSSLKEAQTAVSQLKANLSTAFNVETGKLDLSRFKANMDASGQSIQQYRVALQSLGPEGRKAFRQLTSAVVQGELPLKRTKNLLTSMISTFGSSIKWTIAYGAINKVTQGISEAFRYTQELDKSLTHIGVVANKNTDEMAKFAKQANESAKALATSTKAYADASLIYYQQGLDDNAVKERTEATIKMSQVTGQSAQETSEQLTAIWNNFDDGSKKLEYYADVLVKLGAETASSADEISQGFEKFAAVADMVGLSYENGAAALATVTATTRQSADVVGTAFKTLFARIQDLELGKTLDDGTTLGSYSEALSRVGVNIKTATGELKDMDDILAEMGDVWNTLGEDQQVALAKSVAGVRQYTQLVALMENYDYYEELTLSANDAEGELEKQNNRWADSWEAAQGRVEASAQGLYSSLIDDEFFINLTNMWADLISGVNSLVEAMGGMKTLLPFLAGWLLKAFGPSMVASIGGFAKGLKGAKSELAAANATRTGVLEQQVEMGKTSGSIVDKTAGAMAQSELNAYKQIEDITRKLSKQEIQVLQYQQQELQNLQNMALEYAEMTAEIQKQIELKRGENRGLTQEFQNKYTDASGNSLVSNDIMGKARGAIQQAENYQAKINNFSSEVNSEEAFRTSSGKWDTKAAHNQLAILRNDKGLMAEINKLEGGTQLVEDINKSKGGEASVKDISKRLSGSGINFSAKGQQEAETIINGALGDKAEEASEDVKKLTSSLSKNSKEIAENNITQGKYAKATRKSTKAAQDQANVLAKTAKQMKKAPLSEMIMQSVGAMGMALAGVSSLINGIKSLSNVFAEEEFSWGNFISALSAIGMSFLMIVPGINAFTTAIRGSALAQKILNTQETIYQKFQIKKIKNMGVEAAIRKLKSGEITKEQFAQAYGVTLNNAENRSEKQLLASYKLAIAAKKRKKTAQDQENVATATGTTVKKANTIATIKNTAARIKNWIVTNWLVAAIIAAIAVLAIFIGRLISQKSAEEKAAEAAKEAGEAVNNLTEQYKKLTEKAEAFKEAVSGYEDAIDALDGLVKGTKAYDEALEEANEKAKELIETYELYGQYTIKDGLITFNEGALAAAQTEMNAEAAETGVQLQAAKIRKNQAEETSRNLSLGKDLFYKGPSGLYGAFADGATGKVEKVIDAINNFDAEDEGQRYSNIEDYLQDVLPEDEFEAITNSAGDLNSELEEAAKASKKASEANEEYAKNLMKEQIRLEYGEQLTKLATDSSGELNEGKLAQAEEHFAQIASQSSEIIAQYQEEIQKEANNIESTGDLKSALADAGYSSDDYGSGGEIDIHNDKELAKTYAVLAGYANSRDEVVYKRGSGEGTIIVDGEEKTFNDEYMRREVYKMLETKKMLEENGLDVNGVDEDYVNLIANAAVKAERAGATYGADFSMALLNADEKGELDMGTVLANISPQEREKLMSLSNEEIYKLFGFANEEEVKAAGFASGEAFAQQYKAGLATEYDLDAYESNLKARAKALAEESGIDETELQSFKDLLYETTNASKLLSDAIAGNGEAALAVSRDIMDYSDALQSIADNSETWKELIAMGGQAQNKAIAEMEPVYRKMLGMETAEFSQTFVNNNAELLFAAAEGNIAAYNRLLELAKKDIIDNLNIREDLKNEIKAGIPELEKELAGLDIGATIDPSTLDWFFEEIINKAKLTAEQAQALLASRGIDIEVSGNKGDLTYGEATKSASGELKAEMGYVETETPSERKKRLRDLDEELERYHEIDEIIENIERDLDKLSKAKDRAFGNNKIALMKKELETSEDLLESQRKRQEEAENYLQDDANYIMSKYNVEFDDQGNISNYEELVRAQVEKMRGMKGGTEAYEKEEEYLDQLKEDLEQYEETLDTVYDMQQTVIDATNELKDLAMEQIEYTVQMKVEASEDDLAYIDFMMQQYEDDDFAAAEKIRLETSRAGEILEQIEANQDGYNQVLAKIEDQNGVMEDADVEALREYRDNLIDLNSELQEIENTISENLIAAFDAWNEELDKNIEKFDQYNSRIEHWQNIIDIVGQDRLGLTNDIMNEMLETQLQNAASLTNASKVKLEANKATLENLKAQRAAALTPEDEEFYDDLIEHAEEAVLEATEEFEENWENELQAIADSFEYHINQIVETFEESVSGIYGTIDKLTEAFERAQTISDLYLDNYEKTYEISKLNRQIEQSLDKTDNINSQKQLRQLQNEILELSQEGVDVSKYDIELMQKKYDLLVAEQALRDAQNAKSTVRLQRDSSGNYGYIYTADQDSVADAQQNYEDKIYEIEKYSDEMVTLFAETYFSLLAEYRDALAALAEAHASGDEEAIAEAERMVEYYTTLMNYYSNESAKFFSQTAEINDQFGTDMATSLRETFLGELGLSDTVDSFEELFNKATIKMTESYEDFKKEVENYSDKVEQRFEEIGLNTSTLQTKITKEMGLIRTQTEKTTSAVEDMATKMDEALNGTNGAIATAEEFRKNFSNKMSQVRNEISSVITELNKMLKLQDVTVSFDDEGNMTVKVGEGSSSEGEASSGEDDDLTTASFNEIPPQDPAFSPGNNVKTISNAEWYTNDGTGLAGRSTSAEGTEFTILDSVWNKGINENTYKVKTASGSEIWLAESDLELGGNGSKNIPQMQKASENWKYNPAIRFFITEGMYNKAKKNPNEIQYGSKYKYFFDGENVYFNEPNSSSWGDKWFKETDGSLVFNSEIPFFISLGDKTYYTLKFNSVSPLTNGKSFDTGGYTGSWGSEGRWAMLHQKEIVLNAQDTENFLSAINIVRSIADQLESNALAAKLGLTAYSAASVKAQGDILQQEVHITAEFPNVTDHNEIEQALMNLNNVAAQYANR